MARISADRISLGRDSLRMAEATPRRLRFTAEAIRAGAGAIQVVAAVAIPAVEAPAGIVRSRAA